MNEPKAPNLAYKKLDASAEFFAAVRFLQVMSNKRLGDDTHVGDEPMRLVAKAAIDYPATEVANVQATEDGLLKTEVSFLGCMDRPVRCRSITLRRSSIAFAQRTLRYATFSTYSTIDGCRCSIADGKRTFCQRHLKLLKQP